MNVSLVLTEPIANQFAEAAQNPLETAGVLLARIVEDQDGNVRLLARSIHWIAEDDYLVRTAVELKVASHVYTKSLREAEANSEVAIWVHTHPNGYPPLPSEKDNLVESLIADVFRVRTGSKYFGSLILSKHAGSVTFTGRLATEIATITIDRMFIVGDRWRLIRSFDNDSETVDAAFDRNVRAFGPGIQKAIGELRIAIIGCGGTGSAVAEQLVRLGARSFFLIDPDTVSETNITRLYGSTPASVGQPKVDVVASNLQRIAPSARCKTIQGMVTDQNVARQLTTVDIIFGCSDDNAGRIVLSRLSTYFIIPVIDCGVLLAGDSEGGLRDINGRVTTMLPGSACMICRGRVDLVRARSEMLSTDERLRLENEGYAPILGRTEPAVVTFTTSVASLAVTELLERLIGFGPDPRPSEILVRFHDREISTNLAMPVGRHFCNPAQGKIGKGFTEPFLEQVWQ